MTTRQIRDLAIRILGLYYLAHAIIYLPQIAGFFFMSDKEIGFAGNRAVVVFATLVPIIMYFVVAYWLCLKTRVIMALLWPAADDGGEAASVAPSLSTWVALIGLFYVIGSVGSVTSELWRLGITRDTIGSWVWYTWVPQVITLVLAVICIVKARPIGEHLKRITASAPQPPAN